jgi:hypothetical protein
MISSPVRNSNPKEALDKINNIENIFPVHAWNINGLKIWPFIRTSLAYSQNTSTNMRRVNSATKKFPLDIIKKILKRLRILLFFPSNYIKVLTSLKKSDHIFSGANTHCSFIEGKLINKFFDSEVEEMNDQGINSVIFDNSLVLNEKRINKSALSSLPVFYIAFEIKRMLFGKSAKSNIQLDQYDEFYAYLVANFVMKKTFEKAFRTDFMIKRLETLYGRKEFLKSHLARSRVRYAYFLCYYSSLYYPLIAACNELDIKTIDIQHGGIGRGHYCYDNWQTCPEKGYSLLPRYFWTWDQHTANIINEWASKTDYHRAIHIGNPWISTVLDKYNFKLDETGYILYNMNETSLDKFIVETIKHFKSDFKWMLRMHPRSYFNKGVLVAQIESEGLSNYVTIEDAVSVPLPMSILNCSIFISKASGSVVEAVALGLKPLLLRSANLDYSRHYIDEGKAYLLEEDSSSKLIEFLSKTPPAEKFSRMKSEKSQFKVFEEMVETN